jgi:hypothetical protein
LARIINRRYPALRHVTGDITGIHSTFIFWKFLPKKKEAIS